MDTEVFAQALHRHAVLVQGLCNHVSVVLLWQDFIFGGLHQQHASLAAQFGGHGIRVAPPVLGPSWHKPSEKPRR
eukprot:9385535-Heterocapsa_arctica.AAC.1